MARERHFGRAAEARFVSQPTLGVAIKKLDEELDVKLFERGTAEHTQRRQQTWPGTVAYIARPVIHRYAMLHEQGYPVQAMGILVAPAAKSAPATGAVGPAGGVAGLIAGKACPDCGNHTLIQKDGCEFCAACGFVGPCG